MNNPLAPFFNGLIKTAQTKAVAKPAQTQTAKWQQANQVAKKVEDAKKVAKKPVVEKPIKNPVVKKPAKTSKDLLKEDVAKGLNIKQLTTKYDKLSKADILEAKVEAQKGGPAAYKSYLSTAQPLIGKEKTDLAAMHTVYDAINDSGLSDEVKDSLKEDWFGDEKNIDWTKGGDGADRMNDMLEQINDMREQMGRQGEQGGPDPENPAGIYAKNLPMTEAVPGLAEEAAKIKATRESMKDVDKDMANRYINPNDPQDFAQLMDNPTDQALYQRGVSALRNKMTQLGIK